MIYAVYGVFLLGDTNTHTHTHTHTQNEIFSEELQLLMHGPVSAHAYITLVVMMSIVTGAFGHVSVCAQHRELSTRTSTTSKLVSDFRSD